MPYNTGRQRVDGRFHFFETNEKVTREKERTREQNRTWTRWYVV